MHSPIFSYFVFLVFHSLYVVANGINKINIFSTFCFYNDLISRAWSMSMFVISFPKAVNIIFRALLVLKTFSEHFQVFR